MMKAKNQRPFGIKRTTVEDGRMRRAHGPQTDAIVRDDDKDVDKAQRARASVGTQHGVCRLKLCDFGATEVNEKTTRPRTYSPGKFLTRS